MNSNLRWTILGSSTCIVVLLLLGARSGRAVAHDDVYGHLKVYTEVLERIKLEYVEEPDMKSVTLGAINGLLESVDPFASYLNADQYRQYEKGADTGKAGVGWCSPSATVMSRLSTRIPGSPADKANIITGDLIESINNVATRDMPLAYAEELLRGDAGSTINITVLRLKNPEPEKITLNARQRRPTRRYRQDVAERGRLSAPGKSRRQPRRGSQNASSPSSRSKAPSTSSSICGIAPPAIRKKAFRLPTFSSIRAKSLICEGQKTAKQDFTAKPEDDVWQGPLVVITDRATAGGSEIAAAALLDDKRAQVVGERSYGDASLRKTIQMDDGGAVILSVAKYYSPSGKAIQDGGITPSVPLAENDSTPDLDQDGNPLPGVPAKPTEDNLLKQSIELVTGKTTIAQLTE